MNAQEKVFPEKMFRSCAMLCGLFCLAVSAAELSKPEIWKKISSCFAPPPQYQNQFGSYRSPLIFPGGQEVKTPQDWARRRKQILSEWHDLMGSWPPLLEKPGLKFLDREKREKFIQHRVQIEIAEDLWEEAYLLIPEGTGPFPGVLIP